MSVSCRCHWSWALFLLVIGLLLPAPRLEGQARDDAAAKRREALAKTVTIHRDQFGVPHVYAPTDAACVFGFAYAQAEDYFWQVEDNYLRGLGRAAEVYGEAGLPDDLLNRALEIPRLAQEEYARADPRMRALCDAMADGLNYYLATHPETKPRLITHFEPWHPIAFGRYALFQMFIYRKSGLRPQQIVEAVREIKEGKEEAVKPPLAIRQGNERGAPWPLFVSDLDDDALNSQHVGSNTWAISPSKSATGRAMLFINPHQPYFGPGQWYEGHLVSGEGWNLSGACFFGSPFPTIGYNGYVAWSHTVNDPDIADAYVEKFDDPAEPLHYRHGDGHKRATQWTDTLVVATDKAKESRKYQFRKTHHGPVVATERGMPVTIKMARFLEGGMLEEWYAMGKAKSVAEFKAAMQPCAIPMFNAMVADRNGNIYYVYNGAIPRRSTKFDWVRAVDGSNPETEWQGYHAFAELPQLENPPTGYLQNCNQTPFTTTTTKREDPSVEDVNPRAEQFPNYFVREQDNGRARISRRILHRTPKFAFDDWVRASYDTTVIEAEALVPPTVAEWEKLRETDAERYAKLKEPMELLKQWDGVSKVDSVAMTVFAVAMDRGQQMIQRRDIGNSPRVRALEAALADLEKEFGTWKVAWGEINRLQRIHGSQIDGQGVGGFNDNEPSLACAGAPGTLGIVFNFYARPQPGQKRRYGVAGHSFVGVVEMSPRTHARTVLVFGQSGDSRSPHYFDQAPLFVKHDYKPCCFHEDEVRSATRKQYQPGSIR